MTRPEKFRLESDILQKLYDVYDNIAKYLIEGENRFRIVCYILDQDRVIHHYKEGLFPIQEGLESEYLLLDNSIIYNHFAKLVDIANDIYKTKGTEPASWDELITNVRCITYKLLDVFPICMVVSTEPSEKSISSKPSIL